jgi:serine/threonine protein kinase
VNKDFLFRHFGLKIEDRKPIYQSDSKLILAGKSIHHGDLSVALKFSKINFDLIDTYVKNFYSIAKLKFQPSILKHHEIFKIETSEIDFDLVEVLELVEPVHFSDVFNSGMSPGQLKRMIIKLLEGFQFLHSNKVLHRDIKPDNLILYQEKGEYYFKIIDLDFLGGPENRILVTTPEFLAPEVNSYLDYNVKSEIWAIGLVLYLLFVGKMPFQTRKNELSLEEVKKEVINCDFEFSMLPMPLRIPVSLCLKKNPKDRIGSLGQLIFIMDPIYYMKSRLNSLFG